MRRDLWEFFEGETFRLSMPRLTMFLSFWPSSYIVMKNPTETMLGLYLGTFAAAYLGGKGIDAVMAPKQPQVSAVGTASVSGDITLNSN